MSNSLQPHGLEPTRLLRPWDSPGRNTGVGCHFLLQEIFPTQGSNLGLPYCRQTHYHLSQQGSDNLRLRFSHVPSLSQELPAKSNFVLLLLLFSSIFFFFKFLAALGLHCWAPAFSSCGEWRLPFLAVCKLLITVASLLCCMGSRAFRLSSCGAWA